MTNSVRPAARARIAFDVAFGVIALAGIAFYQVSPSVTTHSAAGTAIYTLFLGSTIAGAPVHAWTSVEAPQRSSVRFKAMTTAVIALGGGIRHIANDTGGAVDSTQPNQIVPGFTASARLASCPY
jgi:hypothetical protein